MTSLEDRLETIFSARDRENMQPTIDAFLAVLAEHPDHPEVLYQVGGAYDTDGQESVAEGYYQRALEAGLDGESLRKCYLQYGSTLRNLGELERSAEMFRAGRVHFPTSLSLGVFELLTLHAQGRHHAALSSALTLFADHVDSPELARYEAALRGNAEYLAGLDRQTS